VIAREALARAGGGGTLVLNLFAELDDLVKQSYTGAKQIARARDEQGWHVHRVSSWEQLTTFAREFSDTVPAHGAVMLKISTLHR